MIGSAVIMKNTPYIGIFVDKEGALLQKNQIIVQIKTKVDKNYKAIQWCITE